MITFEEFQKIELRAGKILEAERIEGSKKLLKLLVDIGKEKRQLVAGIGNAYAPEALIGKEIVVVANLEPRNILNLESQGMLLAADADGRPIILTYDAEVPPGSKIK